MFTKILLPISLFIIIHIYIFCLDITKTEEILNKDNSKFINYIEIMNSKSEITLLMIILIIIYSTFGGILSII